MKHVNIACLWVINDPQNTALSIAQIFAIWAQFLQFICAQFAQNKYHLHGPR